MMPNARRLRPATTRAPTRPQPRTPSQVMRKQLPLTPQTLQEFIWSLYPPTHYTVQWQMYGLTFVCAAAGVASESWPTFPAPLYAMQIAGQFWNSDTGAGTAFPVRMQVSYATGNNWTSGLFVSGPSLGVGNGGGSGGAFPLASGIGGWAFPREIAQNDVIQISVDNSLNAVAIEGDMMIAGYEVRERSTPIDLNVFGQMR